MWTAGQFPPLPLVSKVILEPQSCPTLYLHVLSSQAVVTEVV